MDGNTVLALLGGVIVAFLIRVLNMVTSWLSRILGVDPPEPIPPVEEISPAPRSTPAPDHPGDHPPLA